MKTYTGLPQLSDPTVSLTASDERITEAAFFYLRESITGNGLIL